MSNARVWLRASFRFMVSNRQEVRIHYTYAIRPSPPAAFQCHADDAADAHKRLLGRFSACSRIKAGVTGRCFSPVRDKLRTDAGQADNA